MQPTTPGFLLALRGSHTPTTRVESWYDGELVTPLDGLPISPGAVLTLDADRDVTGQITGLRVPDPDGRWEPRSETAALAPFGSRLRVLCGIDGFGEQISRGWYRITQSESDQRWHPFEQDEKRVWVTRGGAVTVNADDLMWQIKAEKFLAPESPPQLATVLNEIARLTRDIVPMGDVAGITDSLIPTTVTYSESRYDAVRDLAALVSAVPVMSPTGTLDLLPDTGPGTPVWSVDVGEKGVYVQATTSLSADELPNVGRSTGKADDDLPVLGITFEEGGALRFGGPHGRIPTFRDSPLITTILQAIADSQQLLRQAQARREQVLEVECLPNPALELLDTVTLVTPIGPLNVVVRGIRYPLSPGTMQLRCHVPWVDYLNLWAAAS